MNYPREEFAVHLVCSSLRQRPAWSSTATQLLQSDGRRWRETHLGTHDIALTIPDPHAETHDTFHLLLLSPENLTNPQTLPRIQHLHHLSNGHNTALVFLLETQNGAQPAAMQPFMDLHLTLHTHNCPIPIIPLPSSPESQRPDPSTATSLAAALQTLESSLVASRGAARHRRWPVDAVRDLLPYCTTTTTTATNDIGSNTSAPAAAGLSRRAVEVLSGRWFSFAELLGEEGIATEEGRRAVREGVGGAEGEGVVAFWGFEFATAG